MANALTVSQMANDIGMAVQEGFGGQSEAILLPSFLERMGGNKKSQWQVCDTALQVPNMIFSFSCWYLFLT